MRNFDIVVPVGPNDNIVIRKQIEYTKRNIVGYRKIFLICCDDSLIVDGCITISEKIFPFSLESVAKIHGKRGRNGWYLQQLLKLYAGIIIPEILDTYLVIDADTFFIRPVTFIENEKALYNYGSEYHNPYFYHMIKLHPELNKCSALMSGICHHMLFETKYISELFEMVEKNHNGDSFYNVFLKNVIDLDASGASEYEIYFNFIVSKHADDIKIRQLRWKNTNDVNDLQLIQNYDYISYHWYLR
jgi:hypothetical protein